jgi:ribosomal protein L16 Arg81 hydroxylase
VNEILNGVASSALAHTDDSLRYSDPDLKAQAPGEIPADAIAKIKNELQRTLLSDTFLQDWLGRFTTEPYSDVDLKENARKVSPGRIRSTLAQASSLVRAEGARFAFTKSSKGGVAFFYNGDRRDLTGKAAMLAQEIANRVVIPASSVQRFLGDKGCQELLSSLLTSGALLIEE